MKKIWLATLSLLLIVSLLACGQISTTTGGTDGTGGTGGTGGTASTSGSTPGGSTPANTTAEAPNVNTPDFDENKIPAGEREQGDTYLAVKNSEKWVPGELVIDATYSGSGSNIISAINGDYPSYRKEYYSTEDGQSTRVAESAVRGMGVCGASVEVDEASKTVRVTVTKVEVKIWAEYSYVQAQAGSYLMFNFRTNVDSTFAVTVTPQPDSSAKAAYLQTKIEVKGSKGNYSGTAKCTVPYQSGKKFYINLCVNGGSDSAYETATNVVAANYPVLLSIPVDIIAAKYESRYSLMFQGDWELVRDKEYLPNLIDLFYNTYPRLYARFANGSEPRQITFVADKTYDGVAYCQGTRVVVATAYANSNPTDLGFFSHEITHSVQQYANLNYGDNAWWTENMANYGGFRYFHWGYSTKFVQIYSMSDRSLQDWGYEAYGNNKVFFAYMDYKYPTTVDANGKKTLGLIDAINHLIKTSTVMLNDNPKAVGSPFNNVVKEVTGLDTIEAVRLQFVKELNEGTWAFVGFRDYTDNFLTENIPGVPNPTYPMLESVTPGDKTNPLLSSVVTEGENLALNATVLEYSSQTMTREQIANAFDGDVSTKWCSTKATSSAKDHKYELAGYQHGFVIDLGAVKTFNTYTMINAGEKEENTKYNPKSWEVLVSVDGETWVSVDYQANVDRTNSELSVNVGEQTARYIQLRFFAADNANTGTVRLYEFMLFNQ